MREVLIIEDDESISELIDIHLHDMSCEVTKAINGKVGYEMANAHQYDLIILDIMLPEMDGIDICTKLRQKKNTSPVIMLTAKSDDMDKILGLESGADVYVTKPFNILEFKARVKALFRRIDIVRKQKVEDPGEVISFDDLIINLTKKSVYVHECRLDLTPKEFDLLALLASHPGRSYPREQLLQIVWGYDYNAYEHTVNSHINRLRAKIEPDMSNPKYILTTWGVGYRFAEYSK